MSDPTPTGAAAQRERLARLLYEYPHDARGSEPWDTAHPESRGETLMLADRIIASGFGDVAEMRRYETQLVESMDRVCAERVALAKERDTFRTAFIAANDQAEHNAACLLTVEAERDALDERVKAAEGELARMRTSPAYADKFAAAREKALRAALTEIQVSTSTFAGDSLPHEARDAAHAIARRALAPADDADACRFVRESDATIARLEAENAKLREAWIAAHQCISDMHEHVQEQRNLSGFVQYACDPTKLYAVLLAYDQRNHEPARDADRGE